MAAASESVRFDIIGNDKASDAFSKVGRAAGDMGGKMDAAAEKAALLDGALQRQRAAAKTSADATLALAKSDAILDEAERRLRDGALEAEFALKKEEAALKGVKREADRLDGKKVRIKVEADRSGWGRLGSLFGGGGGAGASGGGGFLSALPAAGGLVNPYTIAGAAAVSPFLAQGLAGSLVLGLGGALAGLGIAGAFGTGKTVTAAQMTAAQDALRAAQLREAAAQAAASKKPGAASQATLASAQGSVAAAQARLAQLQNSQQTPAQLQMRQSFANLSNDAQDSLAKIGKSFIPVMQSVFSTADSVLKKMTPLFAGAERTIAGPFKTFADTLLNAFNQPAVRTSITAVAGAFGKLLTALTPQLAGDMAQVADGITRIARSVAEHPQAFADFIKGFFKLAGIALDAISALANFGGYLQQHFWPAMHRTAVIFDGVRHEVAHILANLLTNTRITWNDIYGATVGAAIRTGHDAEKIFNDFRHRTAVVFDGVRHETAHAWDMTWNNTVGRAQRGFHDVAGWFDTGRHAIAGTWDTVRHGTAAAWDTIWNNTVTRTKNGVGDVMTWISGIPGKVTRVFSGAKTWLLGAGKDVIQGLWDGLTFIWNKVTTWIGSLAGWIAKHKGPVALDRQLLYPAGRALMTGLKVGLQHGFMDIKSIVTGAASDIGNWIMGGGNKMLGIGLSALHGLAGAARAVWDKLFGGGRAGGGVQQWAGTVMQALAMERLSPALLGNVLFQMQTESGGNPNAINLSDFNATVLHDPSRGLMQVIGSTFSAFHWPGTSWDIYDPLANVAAALHYASLRYGPTLMSGGMGIGSGHGYALGTSSAAPGWALVGEHGPELMHFRGGEQVIPARAGGGGTTYVINVAPAPLARPADIGREIVGAIRAFEKGSGTSWRR